MDSLAVDIQEPIAHHVFVSEDSLTVDLVDGRTIIAPLSWYPRLWYGTVEERNHFEIIGNGTILHWPDLDEDVSVEGLILGRPSGESQASLAKWFENRRSRST